MGDSVAGTLLKGEGGGAPSFSCQLFYCILIDISEYLSAFIAL